MLYKKVLLFVIIIKLWLIAALLLRFVMILLLQSASLEYNYEHIIEKFQGDEQLCRNGLD